MSPESPHHGYGYMRYQMGACIARWLLRNYVEVSLREHPRFQPDRMESCLRESGAFGTDTEFIDRLVNHVEESRNLIAGLTGPQSAISQDGEEEQVDRA